MGILWSKTSKGLKNINAYHRAHKVLSQEKPQVAPRHPTTKKLLDEFATENPQTLIDQKVKNVGLLERLKDVKVNSYGAPAEIKSARNLPEIRTGMKDNPYGVKEPDIIPEGKLTLRLVHEMLISYQMSPNEQTVSKFSELYKLDEKTVEQVVAYFKALDLYMPEKQAEDPKVLENIYERNILPLYKSKSVFKLFQPSKNTNQKTSNKQDSK